MKLKKMLSGSQIASMRGVVDFYYWKGIPCGRSWPKKPKQPGTPAQLVTWAAFRACAAWRRALPAEHIEQWRTMPMPANRVYRNIISSHGLKFGYRNALTQAPVITSVVTEQEPWVPRTRVVITHADRSDFIPANVTWFYTADSQGAPLLAWNRAGIRVRRDNYAEQLYRPNLAPYAIEPGRAYDAGSRSWYLYVPLEVTSVRVYATSNLTAAPWLMLSPVYRST